MQLEDVGDDGWGTSPGKAAAPVKQPAAALSDWPEDAEDWPVEEEPPGPARGLASFDDFPDDLPDEPADLSFPAELPDEPADWPEDAPGSEFSGLPDEPPDVGPAAEDGGVLPSTASAVLPDSGRPSNVAVSVSAPAAVDVKHSTAASPSPKPAPALASMKKKSVLGLPMFPPSAGPSAAMTQSAPSLPPSASATCAIPGCKKTVFANSLYCSRGHAAEGQKLGAKSVSAPPMATAAAGAATCQTPGCGKPAFAGSFFCSLKHMEQGKSSGATTCALAGCSKPVAPGFSHCGRTHADAAKKAASAGLPSRVDSLPSSPAVVKRATGSAPSLPSAGGATLPALPPAMPQWPAQLPAAPAGHATAHAVGSLCAKPGCTRRSSGGMQYCGKSHAAEEAAAKGSSVCAMPDCLKACSGKSFGCCPDHFDAIVRGMKAKGPDVCRYLPCSKAAHVGSDGAAHKYCSQKDAQKDVWGQAGLFELQSGSALWKSVQAQLEKKWSTAHAPLPKIVNMFEVKPGVALAQRFEQYRQKVSTECSSVFGKGKEGNVQRRFHGTKRLCGAGTATPLLCAQSGCSVCGILAHGFDKSFFGSAPTTTTRKSSGWGRFGRGHYFTSCSSKAHAYNTNPGDRDHLRMIIMCSVVVGHGHKMHQDDMQRTEPPHGYHSVLGEVGGGGSLNYDELCIYSDEAILPTFLIMY